ncbi:kinase-like domain-containing protein [Trametes maxima]|nr:kinase-like domain-containing protein [Trametes maxima]
MAPASNTMPNFTGCIVDERFQLLRLLGAGTYGVVYQAVDIHPDADPKALYRAVKIVSKSGRTKTQLGTVRREIALQSKVSGHPNIVGLCDAFEDNEYFYIILDFCPGGDLFEHITERKTYAGNDALVKKAFVSLVDALAACHDAKIYHRDLKPENVLTSKDGSKVYLADFGLAISQPIVEDFGVGTTIYMSPECVGRQTGFKPFSARYNDIWALGVILVNMISGRHPWQKPTTGDECFARFVEDPDFLLEMLPISDGANDILQRIFALKPSARISLAELRTAILELDTFFLSDEELSEASEFAQIAAAALKEPQSSGRASAADAAAGPLGEMDIGNMVPERDITTTLINTRSSSPAVKARSTTSVASEIDIAVWPVRAARDCSAGSAVDSAASSRASSSDLAAVITPEDTTCKGVSVEKDIGDSMWERRIGDTAEYLISRLNLHI